MNRVYNFSAGPSMLPLSVLERAQSEMFTHGKDGMCVMEMSHRSKMYETIHESAKQRLIRLMNIPEGYEVLFMQGGATLQFSLSAMNLCVNCKADYINSGNFAGNAIKEAQKVLKVNVVASSKDVSYSRIPEWDEKIFDPGADFFHITTNNTIFGTRYTRLPQTGGVPLVADMSSNILSEVSDVTDVSNYGLIYAGAQKNVGPAGLTLVIIRKDLIARSKDSLPSLCSYKVMAENDSMINTPPCYSIYMADLVFEWLENQGGVAAIQKVNERKAKVLYDCLDASKFFSSPVNKPDRSIMNVTFVTPSAELDDKFVKEATAAGFVNLKGHRLVGGMRASIYNAMPEEGVAKLCDFMRAFEKKI